MRRVPRSACSALRTRTCGYQSTSEPLNLVRNGKSLRHCRRAPVVQFMGIRFQRNRFVGAAVQETCNVLSGEFFQSQLFVLDDVDEFTEQEPVRDASWETTVSTSAMGKNTTRATRRSKSARLGFFLDARRRKRDHFRVPALLLTSAGTREPSRRPSPRAAAALVPVGLELREVTGGFLFPCGPDHTALQSASAAGVPFGAVGNARRPDASAGAGTWRTHSHIRIVYHPMESARFSNGHP